MKQKILLLSEARHGTTYAINELKHSSQHSSIKDMVICYEPLSRGLEQKKQCYDCLKSLNFSGEFDNSLVSSKLHKFYNNFMDVVDGCSKDIFVMKVFVSHIYYTKYEKDSKNFPKTTMKIQDVISRFDKVIILNRNFKEYIFSHANAYHFPKNEKSWHISTRGDKKDDFILQPKMLEEYSKILKNREHCFSETRKYCAKHNKEILELDYKNLGSLHKEFAKFAGINKLKCSTKFEPIKHNYETFLKLNPSVQDLF